jgi:hypothetical protein
MNDGGSSVETSDGGNNSNNVDGGNGPMGGTISAGGFYDSDQVVFIAAPGCGCSSTGHFKGDFPESSGVLFSGVLLLWTWRRRRKR